MNISPVKAKNKPINILVFPCGSEIGLEIYNSCRFSTYFHLVGLSSINDHGMFVYDDYVGDAPFLSEGKELIKYINEIIENRHIEAIYPTMDAVITFLKEQEIFLKCKVISPALKTVQICNSKILTYDILQKTVRVPELYNKEDLIKDIFPVFVKPIIGYGSKGANRVNNIKEIENIDISELLISEYLPGEEYTVDCFSDKTGNLLYCRARFRNRIKSGISVNTSFVEHQDEFEAFAERIISTISFRGAWFFQVKRDKKGKLCLMEIAARFAGSSGLSRMIGINLPLMTLFDFFGFSLNVLINEYDVVMDRAFDEKYKCKIEYDTVYVDYDDCLILNKKTVNSELVGFLYRCINHNKKIVLLTHHKGDLYSELKQFRLEQLFDEIIWVEDDKKNYIEGKAIFIDDSFTERKEVSKMGIYTFSPDMIDVLE